ncbi:hypothetical protein [Massilia psychrophila]|uniref:hypothetical protein n=1 Tax=Massilia psychrophila TaxID=1603353 RepID=UPI000C1A7934|nr:hypothetical protein [Massilia psychrophila]GGE67192.1 hypothetical protein GCM10008020_09490 [Massilia psychrophila]
MKTAKPDFRGPALASVLASVLALALGPAAAQAPAPATAKEAGVKPPPVPKPIKRRSVQQAIEPTPRIVTEGYRPTATVRPPAAAPQPPARMNSCGPGGCFDTGGARYNGNGGGNTLLSPNGQLCVKGVVNAQCF